MPAIAALVLADGQSSPANHTFSPGTIENGRVMWEDRSIEVPAGRPSITAEVRRAGTGGLQVNQTKGGFNLPTLNDTGNENPNAVLRNSSGSIVLNLHPQSTLQERKDLLAYMTNWLALAVVKTAVNDTESWY